MKRQKAKGKSKEVIAATRRFRNFDFCFLIFDFLKGILRAVATCVPFVLIFLLSPELGVRFANRFLEPIMDKQKSLHLSRSAWEAVRFFRETPRTEEAFYLRFQLLGASERRILKDHWKLRDDWTLYRRLCRFWGVGRRVTRADRAEQGYWDLEDRQLRLPFPNQEAAA